MKTKTFRPTLLIGLPCWWYRQGDMATTPLAALVTSSNDSGVLDLMVFPPNAVNSELKRAVRHKNDPWLETGPGKEIVLQMGCWDYIGGVQPATKTPFANDARAVDAKVREFSQKLSKVE